jgi:hypothetical protein
VLIIGLQYLSTRFLVFFNAARERERGREREWPILGENMMGLAQGHASDRYLSYQKR